MEEQPKDTDLQKPQGQEKPRKLTILDDDDVMRMVPALAKHPKLVRWMMKVLWMDKVNKLHADNTNRQGADVAAGFLHDLDVKLKIDNLEQLNHLPQGAFVTVSNHHFGAMDGIILIDLIGSRRPGYKVMVNMFLNYIWALRPCFIAVDPMASADPKKKAVSMAGIKEAIMQVRQGRPVGFFPAGAVGKIDWKGRLHDRQWQPSIIRLIQQLKVPVVPIFFHGSQSWLFNLLGKVWWQGRQALHPREVFRKKHSTFHVSVGNAISVEEQLAHAGSIEELGQFLREKTYELRDCKKKEKEGEK